MKKHLILILMLTFVGIYAQNKTAKLSYHNIVTDSEGKILPWYSNNLGESYDHVINLVWKFWDSMRTDMNGLPYYMNHQVWKKDYNDGRGIGGDQVSMALSSWRLYYQYTGNPKVLENMKFMADYYLSHGLSSPTSKWQNIPYPYNTLVYSGIYDGDMIKGKNYTQPDKAGSFGYELINLYKMTGNVRYVEAAIDIANTLSSHVVKGGKDESPLPFRVNAETGELGTIVENGKEKIRYSYTSNWTGTMKLFKELISLKKGNSEAYQKSFDTILEWMKNYPLKTNTWGPFFEDVGAWSDTQINALTFAEYILDNPDEFPDWKKDSFSAIDWAYDELSNETWEKLGAAVVNEQTAYRVPGNSHTARQGAVELLYSSKTGDAFRKSVGLKQLSWATYMVNDDGENSYPNRGNETWMTDGYGDYVRHYLKAFSAFPELAPADQNHLVKSTSTVCSIKYSKDKVDYEVFDNSSTEIFRLTSKPNEISIDTKPIVESSKTKNDNSWLWEPLEKGGILKVDHKVGRKVSIKF